MRNVIGMTRTLDVTILGRDAADPASDKALAVRKDPATLATTDADVVTDLPDDAASVVLDVAADDDDLVDLLAREAEGTFRTGERTVLMARCDDLARRIVRDGGQVTYARLAREIGTSPATLQKLMGTRLYRETYSRVADEILGTIDEHLRNERMDVLSRSDSLQRRALTVLASAMDVAEKHMADVRTGAAGVIARPSIMQAGIDAAAEVRQVVAARTAMTNDAGGKGGALTVNKVQAVVIQGALAESGVDMSDILGAVFGRERRSSTKGEAA